MTNEENIKWLKSLKAEIGKSEHRALWHYAEVIDLAIEALKDRPQGEWNTHEVACLLADVFGDTCACNYNGIDEWLPSVCEFAETECPNPVGVACWEQYAKHRLTDMRGGTE